MTTPSVSVIVPTLNEAATLEGNLPPLLAAAPEVIVTDGGSSDGTVEIAERLGARVVSGETGRGPQLNSGAAAAHSDVLLFLHADTLLPPGALTAVRRSLAEGAVGGGFEVRFDSDRPAFRLGSRVVNLRTHWTKSPLGDQAQFALHSVFDDLGGYPEWPLLEDLEFIRRLKRRGKVAILAPPVTTSVRRFESRGITRTIVRNWLIFALYFAGASPARLARMYRTTP